MPFGNDVVFDVHIRTCQIGSTYLV